MAIRVKTVFGEKPCEFRSNRKGNEREKGKSGPRCRSAARKRRLRVHAWRIRTLLAGGLAPAA